MRHSTEWITGIATLKRDAEVRDVLTGGLYVPSGVRLELHGVIIGDLIVDRGGVAAVLGTVNGTIINQGGDVEITGTAGAIRDSDPSWPTRVANGGRIGL